MIVKKRESRHTPYESLRVWVLNRNTSLINLMRGYIEMPAKPPPKTEINIRESKKCQN